MTPIMPPALRPDRARLPGGLHTGPPRHGTGCGLPASRSPRGFRTGSLLRATRPCTPAMPGATTISNPCALHGIAVTSLRASAMPDAIGPRVPAASATPGVGCARGSR